MSTTRHLGRSMAHARPRITGTRLTRQALAIVAELRRLETLPQEPTEEAISAFRRVAADVARLLELDGNGYQVSGAQHLRDHVEYVRKHLRIEE